jgi:hypothetical protein
MNQSKLIETQELMIKLGDDIRKKLVDELNAEKSFNKALQADNDRLHDLLDNSENNVKRVSLLMSELKLSKAI